LVGLVGELEERQRAAVAQPEEQMTISALGAEQHVRLAPGGHQRQADDVLVELAGRLQILRNICRVMQTRRQFAGSSHDFNSSETIGEIDAPASRQRLEY